MKTTISGSSNPTGNGGSSTGSGNSNGASNRTKTAIIRKHIGV